jgi:hypothetical protein
MRPVLLLCVDFLAVHKVICVSAWDDVGGQNGATVGT